MSSRRPEHLAPPQEFYNKKEAEKYTQNSRIIQIQSEMTERAIQLINFPLETPLLLLDIGCGSGLSGSSLNDLNHVWVGLDISPSMLQVANEKDFNQDLMLQDIGQGVGYKPGSFDGAISISVIQWLCNADQSDHVPKKRLLRFFSTLYSALVRGGKAVFQFYPESSDQIEMIVSSATRAGFTGGIVVDYPNSTRAKKYYLCLFAGESNVQLPTALGADEVVYGKRQKPGKKRDVKGVKDKEWILKKKELERKRGKKVAADSKFTGRSRSVKF